MVNRGNVAETFARRRTTLSLHRGGRRIARLTSLIVKAGALVFVLGLRDQAAINLHLLGAVWVLQILPAIVLGELRVGFMLGSRRERNEAELRAVAARIRYEQCVDGDAGLRDALRCGSLAASALGRVELVWSTTDNPLVLVDHGELVSNGNFHGQPLAFALDALAMAVAELANISERRIERLVNPSLSEGLPPFLTADGGLNSGFMIPQYVAASLVSENKVLAHPASVDSIPTSAGQEDHVSMGNAAGLKSWQVARQRGASARDRAARRCAGGRVPRSARARRRWARRQGARPLDLATARGRPSAGRRHRGARGRDPRRLCDRGDRSGSR